MRTKPLKIRPEHLINRELSWLAFNERILEESLDPTTPLLERVKFFCIFSANLDEFFETRVAGLKQQIEGGNTVRGVDGMTPAETFEAITHRVRKMVAEKYACWHEHIQPALAKPVGHFVQSDRQAQQQMFGGQLDRPHVFSHSQLGS